MAEADNENIQVIVRVRPLNEQERQRGDHECIHIADDGQTVRFVAAPSVRASGAVTAPPAVRALVFDAALVGSSQPDVFENLQTVQLLQDALAGFSITIFAYGQTGSGKTYTMTGPEAAVDADADNAVAPHPAQGLIPRGVGALFELIAAEQASGQLPGGCAVRASYLELYNEQFNDLLNPDSTNLQLRNSPQSGTFVENLLQVDCEGVADAMMVFAEGTRNRKVGSHNLNKDSSRSHCMMTLHLERRDGAPPGKITFVDLAGSERLLESQSAGHAAKETGHINKSLFALGKVISALADSRKRAGHIPYRDSKLTHLLMDSLGGTGRTLMLACCSPSSHHLDETTNTLSFASRAKNIANRPVQPDSGVNMLQQMQATIRALQEENRSLRQNLTVGPPPPPSQQPSPPTQQQQQQQKPAAASGSDAAAVFSVDETGHVAASAAAAPARPKVGISALRGAEGGEVETLRKEVGGLRHENAELKASHAQVLKENAMLAAKLERLEVLFADGPR